MKKAVIAIVAIIATNIAAISGKTPVINVKSHEIVFYMNCDKYYHKTYSCAKHNHLLSMYTEENNDTTVYMQTRNGAKKDHAKCLLCYGLEK